MSIQFKTVEDLIKKLQGYPPKAEIRFFATDHTGTLFKPLNERLADPAEIEKAASDVTIRLEGNTCKVIADFGPPMNDPRFA